MWRALLRRRCYCYSLLSIHYLTWPYCNRLLLLSSISKGIFIDQQNLSRRRRTSRQLMNEVHTHTHSTSTYWWYWCIRLHLERHYKNTEKELIESLIFCPLCLKRKKDVACSINVRMQWVRVWNRMLLAGACPCVVAVDGAHQFFSSVSKRCNVTIYTVVRL